MGTSGPLHDAITKLSSSHKMVEPPPFLDEKYLLFIKVVTELALQVLIIFGAVYIFAPLLPVSFEAVVLTGTVLSISFLSGFFFQEMGEEKETSFVLPTHEKKSSLVEEGEAILPPPGIPRGYSNQIGDEGNNNCWLISLLGLMDSDEQLRTYYRAPVPDDAPDDPENELRRDIKAVYEENDKSVAEETPVCPADLCESRRKVHEVAPDAIQVVGREEDAYEALVRALFPSKLLHRQQITTRYSNGETVVKEDRASVISFAIQEGGFVPSLNVFFDSDGGGAEIKRIVNREERCYHSEQQKIRYLDAPPALWLSPKRFKYTQGPDSLLTRVLSPLFPALRGKTEKIEAPLSDTPDQWRIKLVDDSDRDYRLDAFILHVGPTAQRGHYVLYRCIEDQWHLFDNHQVIPVDLPAMRAALERSYLLHYSPI